MKKMTTILALLLAQNSYALELEGINGVNILAIDGETVKTGFFSSQSISEVSAGEHQIVVRYAASFKNDERIESRPAIFTVNLQQDTKISVDNIKTYQKAQRASRNGFTWQVLSGDNQFSIDNADTLVGEGFMPYSDIKGLVSDYNEEHNIIIANAVKTEPAKTIKPTVIGASTVAVTPAIATMDTDANLISVYQQASREEQRAFRLWLVEQDMK